MQVGVIGECNRDGNRHSRMLSATREGFEVLTMDHDTGALRVDLKVRFDQGSCGSDQGDAATKARVDQRFDHNSWQPGS